MKQVSEKLKALLLSYMRGETTTLYIADLYVFQFNDGRILRFTAHDRNLIVGGNKYTSWAIDHGDIDETRGTSVSNMDLSVYFEPDDEIIPGTTWYLALQSGMFDNCYVYLDYLYSPEPWTWFNTTYSSEYVLKGRFVGRVDVDELKMTSCTLQVKSAMELLNTQLPRNLLMPSCINIFGDSVCGLNKDNYAVGMVAQGGSTKNAIVTGLNHSDGYFSQGTILGITGKNAGVKRTVKTYSSGVANLFQPLQFSVAAGDLFYIYPGCAKTIAWCSAYNNLARYRGYPYVPVPESVL